MTLDLPYPWIADEQIQGNFDRIKTEWPQSIGVWTNYTPTITQSGTVTATVTLSRYVKIGRTVIWAFRLDVTGTGTSSNGIALSLPVTAAQGGFYVVGSGYVYDASVTTIYEGSWQLNSTTSALLYASGASSGAVGSAGMTAALASGDAITGTITYETSV